MTPVNVYQKVVIGNCLISEEFRLKHKEFLKPENYYDPKLKIICELLKEDDFDMQSLIKRADRSILICAIDLINWVADHNYNLNRDKLYG